MRVSTLTVPILATIGFVAAACSALVPSLPPRLGDGQPAASATNGGMLLELWVDRAEASVGDRVFAFVRVTNTGQEAPRWETNTCGSGPAPISVTANTAVEPGRVWDGNAAAFKREALKAAGIVLGGDSLIGEFQEAARIGGQVGCNLMSQQKPFAPGQVVEESLVWDAIPREFVPLAVGEITLTSTFRSDAGAATAFANINLVGRVDVGLTLVDFIDAALAEPSFRAWLERHPPRARMDPNIIGWPNPEGDFPPFEPYLGLESPVVEIGTFYTEDPAAGFLGAVVLDRATARVIGTRFE